jgi:hypothetical protein
LVDFLVDGVKRKSLQPTDNQKLAQTARGQKPADTESNPLSSSNLTLPQMPDLRAERLSVEDFIFLTNAIQQ